MSWITRKIIWIIRRRRCAGFIGAGPSIAAALPSWLGLLDGLVGRLIDRGFLDQRAAGEIAAVSSLSIPLSFEEVENRVGREVL